MMSERRFSGGPPSSDDPPNSRLFIIGPKSLQEEDFRKAFNEYGHIEEIRVVRDRNTGENKGVFYIKYAKTTQAAKALEAMNGKVLGSGRAIKIMVASRSEERGLSRKHIIESVKASLVRLQLSYIDVVIVHKADPMCPMEEVVRAMHYVICQGWVMYWGTARWSPVEIMEAYTNCRQFNCVTPIVEQAEYHMFCREKAELYMPELYNKIGVGLMAWSPISMGFTQGRDDANGVGGGCSIQLFSRASFRNKYNSFSWTEDETVTANKESYTWMKERVQPEESRRQTERIRELNVLAKKLGCTLTQLAIAWCLKNESVQCLLLGASSVDQLYDSIQSLQLIPKLNTNIVTEIERILENKPSRPPVVSTLALR